MAQPITRLPPFAVIQNGVSQMDIPRSLPLKCLLLQFDINYDVAGATVVHEDGIAHFISRIEIDASGVPKLMDMDGFTALQLAQFEQGGPCLIEELTTAVAAGKRARLFLPINFAARDAVNPYSMLFDPRGLAEFKLTVTTRSLVGANLPLSANATFNSCTCTPVLIALDTPRQIAGKVLERRVIARSNQITVANQATPFNLKTGGLLRKILFIARTDVPGAGARTDGTITNISLRRNTSDLIWEFLEFRFAKAWSRLDNDFECATGVGVYSADPEGSFSDEALIPLTEPGLETIQAEVTVNAQTNVILVPEILALRG